MRKIARWLALLLHRGASCVKPLGRNPTLPRQEWGFVAAVAPRATFQALQEGGGCRRFAGLLAAVVVLASGCSGGALPSGPLFGAPHRSLGPARVSARFLHLGTYAWSADDAVSRWKAGRLWPLLEAKRIDDVLLGLNADQITKYATASGRAELDAMIAQGRAHGIAFELLLGDPSWISSAGIGNLESIFRKLRRIDFESLSYLEVLGK